jgi:hypothetical protein
MIHSLSGPSILAAHVDARAVLDVLILTRWLQDDPALRARLWLAEDRRAQLSGLEAMRKFAKRRGQVAPPDFTTAPTSAEMRAEIAQARAEGLAAGLPLPRRDGRVLPSIEQMAQAAPDLWEVYHVAYRGLSPAAHAGGRSFIGDSVEIRKDGTYLKPGTPFDAVALRAIGVPMVCMLFASVSRQVGLGIEAECDSLRLSVVFPDRPS